jgi:hypothetical protein
MKMIGPDAISCTGPALDTRREGTRPLTVILGDKEKGENLVT